MSSFMHLLGILHLVIALFFAVHAMRNGREIYWLFLLFMFPLLGSLVYALTIWLPDQRSGRALRAVTRAAGNLINPGRELREAREALEASNTPGNHLRLADALLALGQAEPALEHYTQSRRGVHADDPEIEVRHAQALLEAGQPAAARELLESLIQRRPDFRSPRGHLTYARAVAASGDRALAREEFQAVIEGYAGLEARARYAEVLLEWDERAEAGEVAAVALKQAKRMPAHARELNTEWRRRLKQVAARCRG
ncbi:MAG: tetratricopeptide repeat protein [Aquimonas sp.]|nr:tetratricopeptide repeat protein [Aquimonas sp.]